MPVDGEFVIAIPSRDILLVTGSNNNDGIKKVKTIAKEIVSKGGYYLTDKLFIYTKSGFVLFDK